MKKKIQILLVDDEPDFLEPISFWLESKGYSVILANNGKQALEVIKSEHLDIVFLDIMMPEMDGYSCLKEIRKLPKTKDIPVLILSGKEEKKVRDLFAFQNISGYLEKPFKLDDVAEKVKEILKL